MTVSSQLLLPTGQHTVIHLFRNFGCSVWEEGRLRDPLRTRTTRNAISPADTFRCLQRSTFPSPPSSYARSQPAGETLLAGAPKSVPPYRPLHCARRGLDKNIVSTTAPERAVLSVMSLGVALRTDESGASEAAETFIFLASIWLAFAGHVVLFWLNSTCFEVGLMRTVIDNVTGSLRAA